MKWLGGVLCWLAVVLAPARAEAAITGWIGSVEKGAGSHLITGWACDSGVVASVEVHVYARSSTGTSTFITAATANVANEPAVNTACGTPSGTAHRFRIPLSNQVVASHGGQALYVYGISRSGGPNSALGGSGSFTVPTQPWGVTGNIDGLTPTSTGYLLTGWACDAGYSQSIAVHVYVGGAAGTPGAQMLTNGVANGSTEVGVNSACQTAGGTPHRFSIPITHAMVNAHYLKPLYVHGISVSGGANSAINGSGVTRMPNVGEIRGNVDAVTDLGTSIQVSGWACQYGVDQSIAVHLYAGGPAGAGTFVEAGSASLSKTADVSSACGTVNSAHRFVVSLTREQVRPHAGKPLYVHGIHVLGDVPNASITGNPTLPRVTYQLSERLPPAGSDFNVLPGERLIINTSADLGIVNIQGHLVCPASGSYVLRAAGILVEGANSLFECGNASSRFTGSLVIRLKGGRVLETAMPSSDHTHPPMGERAFATMHSGTLRLFGDGRRKGWQRLNGTVLRGSSTLVLSTPATDWAVGDRIALSPTSYNFAEAEERLISAISADGRTVQVDRPFSFDHYGLTQTYSNGTRAWTLDERAEVANLTRNIRVEPDGADGDLDAAQFGGHMMVMQSAAAYLDGIELVRMGQMGVMGRYPLHWHLAGAVPGQFIRNSSIRNSYQRCVTLHGTNQATVENNVCFNHFGHGFFLEDGNEVDNQLIGNLTVLSKRIPQAKALLASDYVSPGLDLTRFSPPGAFWISNPRNVVRNNVAAGSEGTGFWMSFSQRLACTATGCFFPDASMPAPAGSTEVRPAEQSTSLFSDNSAHSSEVGMTWDGAPDGVLVGNPRNSRDRFVVASHYHTRGATNPNGAIPVMDRLAVYKNKYTGVYTRGATMTFREFIAADNGNSLFFAYNQVVQDSLIVGFSANHSAADLDFHARVGWGGQLFQGVRLYDGPFDLRTIHFAGFPSQRVFYGSWNATPTPFYAIGGAQRFTNTVRGLTFSPEPYQRIALDSTAGVLGPVWQDSNLTSVVKDLDGSLGGVPGALIVANHPMNRDPACTALPNTTALRCQYDMAMMGFFFTQYPAGVPYDGNIVPSRFERSDGAFAEYNPNDTANPYWNKLMFILNKGYRYRVVSTQAVPLVPRIWFQAQNTSVLSPTFELVGLKASCVPDPALSTRYNTLAELEALTTTAGPVAYFKSGTGSIFMRMRGNQLHRDFRSENAMSATSYPVGFSCP
jgi:cell migration-inducing and hyaluronan-binding protein